MFSPRSSLQNDDYYRYAYCEEALIIVTKTYLPAIDEYILYENSHFY